MRLAVFFFACLFLLWWISAPAQNSATPIVTGQITFILAGTCPAGFSEIPSLDGAMLIGTRSAQSNVGTSAGTVLLTTAPPGAGRISVVRVIFCAKN